MGATAVGPLAAEWIHVLALAIKAEIGVDVLLDGVFQFPTFSERVLAGRGGCARAVATAATMGAR